MTIKKGKIMRIDYDETIKELKDTWDGPTLCGMAAELMIAGCEELGWHPVKRMEAEMKRTEDLWDDTLDCVKAGYQNAKNEHPFGSDKPNLKVLRREDYI